MTTQTIYLSGIAEWAHTLRKIDEKYGTYQFNLYPDDDSKQKIKDAKLGLQYKSGEFGEFIRLRRPHVKLFQKTKELKEFGAPKIMDSEGNAYEGSIGNGSKVTARVTVYDTIKGPGHRLEAVRVDELVTYHKEGEAPVKADKPAFGMPF